MDWFKKLLRLTSKNINTEAQKTREGLKLSDMFKHVGCPKCGAKHKYGLNREYLECYRCSYEFSPMRGRKYTEYMYLGFKRRAELNMLTREEKSLL